MNLFFLQEGRLLLSKSKIRETQEEIDNLHAIDQNVQQKYQEIMESLRQDLLGNETDCKKLQEQIEWVSRRRAELSDEVDFDIPSPRVFANIDCNIPGFSSKRKCNCNKPTCSSKGK